MQFCERLQHGKLFGQPSVQRRHQRISGLFGQASNIARGLQSRGQRAGGKADFGKLSRAAQYPALIKDQLGQITACQRQRFGRENFRQTFFSGRKQHFARLVIGPCIRDKAKTLDPAHRLILDQHGAVILNPQGKIGPVLSQ